MEERRKTDPMIRELIATVNTLDGKVGKLDKKLDEHMADETEQLSDIADNKERLDDLHAKMDQLLDFATVWNDLKGFARVVKWGGGVLAAISAAVVAIMNWPNGHH